MSSGKTSSVKKHVPLKITIYIKGIVRGIAWNITSEFNIRDIARILTDIGYFIMTKI